MKKIIAIGALAIPLFFGGGLVAEANNNNISSYSTKSSVNIDWGDIGEKYKIYRDGELISEVEESNFQDNQLKENYMYTYKIGVFNGDELIDILKYKVKTKDKNKNIYLRNEDSNTYNTETEVTSLVTKNHVFIDWGQLEDNDGTYYIYKNGKIIEKTKKTFYKDKEIESGKTYNYQIIAEKSVTEEKKKEIIEKSIENGYTLFDIPESAFLERKTINKIVKTPESISKKELLKKNELSTDNFKSLAADTLDSFIIRYTTFIPFYKVDNPNILEEWFEPGVGTGSYVTGDGYSDGSLRGFNYFNSSFRTRIDVYAEWYNSSPSYSAYKDIKPTHLYRKDGSLADKQTASTDGITFSGLGKLSDRISWKVHHDVGLGTSTTAPNINYEYMATMYKNGNISASGEHDRAPNHEVYLARAYSGLPAVTLHTYSVSSTDDFKYLFPYWPNEHWQSS
ncbi:DUF3238 domain-containing protein [Rossellomorea sp. BNER]|uniref:DUF3238 domain-containing protein n=1 Tax=Rossellomorea sp. BNER TaxID=2962031 RepID=UPI003AF25C53|nr:DUF3238 domain-containing protein [Rossellomorea sp. BNER]